MTEPRTPAPVPAIPATALAGPPLPPTTRWVPPAALAARPPSRLVRALTAFWAEQREGAPVRVLVSCGALGVAAAWLLVGHDLGVGAALVGLLVWAPAVPALVRRRAVGDLVTAGLSVSLLAMVSVRDAGWVVALCVGAAAGAGAVAATSARSAPAIVLSSVSSLAGGVRALRWVRHGLGVLAGTRRAQVLVALRSVAVTVVLLVVFGLLFASADRVFASYLPRFDLSTLPAQVVVGALVALGAVTLTSLALAPPAWSGVTLPAGRPARRGEWLLPVLALDAMVLAFVLVQVSALLGGSRHVLETVGLTYADYAREGFAQLVVATAATLVVVAVAARRAPRTTPRDRWISRAALATLCIGTLGVVASALRRMDLYVDVFGLTRLRLFVVVVEIVLAVVLVLVMVAGVRWRGGWLPRAVVQVVAVAMIGLAAINPDAQIVRYNTTADSTAALDAGYLRGLSADAVPAIEQLAEPLRSCLLATVGPVASSSGAGWNLGRDRAAQVLGSTGVSTSDGRPCP